MKFYKITTYKNGGFFTTLHTGLNDLSGTNTWITFAGKDVFGLLNLSYDKQYIREVSIPVDVQTYRYRLSPELWKSDKVILSEPNLLTCEVILQLIEEGANIHACSGIALCWSAKSGHYEVVKTLIDNGALITGNPDSALSWACEYGHCDIVKLLLKQHFPITRRRGKTLITLATMYGHYDIVKILLKCGMDIHIDYLLEDREETRKFPKIHELLRNWKPPYRYKEFV